MAFLDNNGLLYLLQKLDGRFLTQDEGDSLAASKAALVIQDMLQSSLSPLGAALAAKADSSDLKTVATSGSYSDLTDKPNIPSTVQELNGIPLTEKGSSGGVATLDGNGKVPASQLPSYVDDVIECYPISGATELGANWLTLESGSSTPLVPESGKIYANLSNNLIYRWGGTAYVSMGAASGGASALTNSEIETLWVGQFGQITVTVLNSDTANTASLLASGHDHRYVIQIVNTVTGGPTQAGWKVFDGSLVLPNGVTNVASAMVVIQNNTVVQTVNPANFQVSLNGDNMPGCNFGGFGLGTYEIVIAFDEVAAPDPGGEQEPVLNPEDPGTDPGTDLPPADDPTPSQQGDGEEHGTDLPPAEPGGGESDPVVSDEPTEGEKP